VCLHVYLRINGIWIDNFAQVTYILNELVTKSGEYKELLDNFDFYIVTNVNPDGYAFTHSDNRLWRKTRSDSNSPLKCIGTDANRNWGKLFNMDGQILYRDMKNILLCEM